MAQLYLQGASRPNIAIAIAGLAQLLAAHGQSHPLRLGVLRADVDVGGQGVDHDPDQPDHLLAQLVRLGEVVLVDEHQHRLQPLLPQARLKVPQGVAASLIVKSGFWLSSVWVTW